VPSIERIRDGNLRLDMKESVSRKFPSLILLQTALDFPLDTEKVGSRSGQQPKILEVGDKAGKFPRWVSAAKEMWGWHASL